MLRIAPNLALPLEAVTQTLAFLARRGAGKTHAATVTAEEMLDAKLPIVVIDPIGVWHGLRSHFSIAILGGKHGDIPLEATGGKAIAEFVVAERLPIILDVSQFGEGEMRRFVGEFCSNLYRLNTEPLHLFVDEADEFAPQNPSGPDGAKCLSAMQNIVRRGRARGLGVTLITQRSAVLSKSVLTQTECLVAMQTTGPQDLKAIDEWLKYHATEDKRREILGSLPTMQQGEAWVYSPGWLKILQRVKFRQRKSADTSRTPKLGEKRVEPRALREVDLKGLTNKMAATIERAKADDPRELRKKIAELERAAKQRSTEVDRSAIELTQRTAEVTGRRRALESILPVLADADRELIVLAKRLDVLRSAIDKGYQLAAQMIVSEKTVAGDATPQATHSRQAVPQTPPPKPRDAARPAPADGISSVSQRILNSLAELEQLGARSPARELVAFLAGYSNLASKGFVNAISLLRTAGHIDYPSSGSVILTDSGRSIAQPPAAPRTAKEVQDRIIGMLGGASGRILQPLIDAYPQAMPREEVASKAGYGNLASKGFVNAMSRLRTLGFVDYPDRGTAIAMPVLFLES